eukprot:7267149-Pyramimonas_sp.AAC.2
MQSRQAAPTIGYYKSLKSILDRAKNHRYQAGLYFRRLSGPFRLASINDAAHATKNTSYAHEAQGPFLMEDRFIEKNFRGEVSLSCYDHVFGAARPLI